MKEIGVSESIVISVLNYADFLETFKLSTPKQLVNEQNDILKIYTHLYAYLTNIKYNKVIYTYFKLQIKESKIEITLQK